jgi:hypothetical protein
MKRNSTSAAAARRYEENRTRAGFLVMAMALAGLFLAGCSNLLNPPEAIHGSETPAAGRGVISIRIGSDAAQARTVQPALAGYQLTFAGGPDHDPVNIPGGKTSVNVSLEDGIYTITATAYKAGGTIGTQTDEVARGHIDVVLLDGVVTNNNGVVPPIVLAPHSSTGKGTLHYKITLGEGDDGWLSVHDVSPSDGNSAGKTSSIDEHINRDIDKTDKLDAGRYLAEVVLFKHEEGKIAYWKEIIEIWPGCTTDLVFEPKPEDYLEPYVGDDPGGPDPGDPGEEFPVELLRTWYGINGSTMFDIMWDGLYFNGLEGESEYYRLSVKEKTVTAYSEEKESGERKVAGTFEYSIDHNGVDGFVLTMDYPTGIFVSIAFSGPFVDRLPDPPPHVEEIPWYLEGAWFSALLGDNTTFKITGGDDSRFILPDASYSISFDGDRVVAYLEEKQEVGTFRPLRVENGDGTTTMDMFDPTGIFASITSSGSFVNVSLGGNNIPSDLVGEWFSTSPENDTSFQISFDRQIIMFDNQTSSYRYISIFASSGKVFAIENGEVGTFEYSIVHNDFDGIVQMAMHNPTGIFASIAFSGPFEKVPYYTVYFIIDDVPYSNEQVRSGGNATPPNVPTRPGYIFDGWQGDYTNVTRDLYIYAYYREADNNGGGNTMPELPGGSGDIPPNFVGTWYSTLTGLPRFEYRSNGDFVLIADDNAPSTTYTASFNGSEVNISLSGVAIGSFSCFITPDGYMIMDSGTSIFAALQNHGPFEQGPSVDDGRGNIPQDLIGLWRSTTDPYIFFEFTHTGEIVIPSTVDGTTNSTINCTASVENDMVTASFFNQRIGTFRYFIDHNSIMEVSDATEMLALLEGHQYSRY